MKQIIFIISFLVTSSCSQHSVFIQQYNAPKGDAKIKTEISAGGETFAIYASISKLGLYGSPWILRGDNYSRSFIGWSPDSKYISVLACSNQSPQLIRRSLVASSAADLENERSGFRLSDENLVSSLQDVRGRSPEGTKRPGDLIDWFCQGYGDPAISRFRSFEAGKEIYVVPYRTSQ